MGCHRLYSYRYTGNSKNVSILGKVVLSTNPAGDYSISRPSKEVVHSVAADSWCHADVTGGEDNLWCTIYPPSEVLQAPSIQERPVDYDFSEWINH
jgi:hypothetical protein